MATGWEPEDEEEWLGFDDDFEQSEEVAHAGRQEPTANKTKVIIRQTSGQSPRKNDHE